MQINSVISFFPAVARKDMNNTGYEGDWSKKVPSIQLHENLI